MGAKVFGGFVHNVKANLFMPATRKSAKAAIVRCAHGWKTSAAISSQIVVCDGPDAFKKKFKANFACKYVKTTPAPKTTKPKPKTTKGGKKTTGKPKKPCKKLVRNKPVITGAVKNPIHVLSWRKNTAATAPAVTAKSTKTFFANKTSVWARRATSW